MVAAPPMETTPRPPPRLAAVLAAWDTAAVTLLVATLALVLARPQLIATAGRPAELSALSRRAATLAGIDDPVERDRLCTPLAARARSLDRELPNDTRVFLSGVVGLGFERRLHVYYFLRNYLFPRPVEISLDGKARFHEWWFDGVPCDSADELRARGFDVQLRFAGDGRSLDVDVVPLSEHARLR